MSETDLIEHIFDAYDRYWAIVQWWASISFSLILVGYFAAERLNIRVVALLSFLYTIYTAWVLSLLIYNIGVIEGFFETLEKLRQSGHELSAGTVQLIDHPLVAPGTWVGQIALLSTFIAATAYLWIVFWRAHRDEDT